MLAEALSRVNVAQHTRFSGMNVWGSPQGALFDSLYPPGARCKICLEDWLVLRDTRRRLLLGTRVWEHWLALRACVISSIGTQVDDSCLSSIFLRVK